MLGPMLERSLRQALAMSHNDPSIFFTRPISLVLVMVAIASLAMPAVQTAWKSRRKTAVTVV